MKWLIFTNQSAAVLSRVSDTARCRIRPLTCLRSARLLCNTIAAAFTSEWGNILNSTIVNTNIFPLNGLKSNVFHQQILNLDKKGQSSTFKYPYQPSPSGLLPRHTCLAPESNQFKSNASLAGTETQLIMAQCTAGQQAWGILNKAFSFNLSCPKAVQVCNKKASATTATAKPTPSPTRRAQSLTEAPYNLQEILENANNTRTQNTKTDTVLYLAYGSNLSAETFRGVRGIQPISEVNVLVPELELTFNLPGIPYQEPCFANTRYRKPALGSHTEADSSIDENDYHKDRWHKGLVGVVYEVTKEDYAIIIATEGGGSAYLDVLVDAYEVPLGSQVVDPHPNTAPFKVHTLYAPSDESSSTPPRRRPDPSYAQASARYLKLITDGAAEHHLPSEYQAFLADLRPYTITTRRQAIGAKIFLGFSQPLIMFLMGQVRKFADNDGKLPDWFGLLMLIMFGAMWSHYDLVFKRVFGDGERTIKPGKGRARSVTRDEEEGIVVGDSRLEKEKDLIDLMG